MSAKRHEFSSYYKVLYIFYPYLEIRKRVLFEWKLKTFIVHFLNKRDFGCFDWF